MSIHLPQSWLQRRDRFTLGMMSRIMCARRATMPYEQLISAIAAPMSYRAYVGQTNINVIMPMLHSAEPSTFVT